MSKAPSGFSPFATILTIAALAAACSPEEPALSSATQAVGAEPLPTRLALDGAELSPVGDCTRWTVETLRTTAAGGVAVTPVAVETTVQVAISGDATLSATSACAEGLDRLSLVIPAYGASAEFWVKGTTATAGVIAASTARDSLEPDDLPYRLAVPGTPSGVRATAPSRFAIGACTPVTIRLVDDHGFPVIATDDTAIELNVAGLASYAMHADAGCSGDPLWPTNLTVRAGRGSKRVWLRVSQAGRYTVWATLAPQQHARELFMFEARDAARVVLTGPAAVGPGQCRALSVRTVDAAGTVTPVAVDTPVVLAGAGLGAFYGDRDCATPLAGDTVVIAAQRGERAVWFKDPGVEELTLSATGLGTTATLPLLVAAATRLKLAGPTSVVFGTCATYTVTLQAQVGGTWRAVAGEPAPLVLWGSDRPEIWGACAGVPGIGGELFDPGQVRTTFAYRPTDAPPAGGFYTATLDVYDAAGTLTPDTLALLVTSPTTVSGLRVAAAAGYADTCIPVNVQAVDAAGQPTVVPAEMAVRLAAAGGTTVYRDAACTSRALQRTVTMAAGTGATTLWVRDARIEELTVTATGTMSTEGGTLTAKGSGALRVRGALEVFMLEAHLHQHVWQSVQVLVKDGNGALSTSHPELAVRIAVGGGVELCADDTCLVGTDPLELTIPANQGGAIVRIRATGSAGGTIFLRGTTTSTLVDQGGGLLAVTPLVDVTITPRVLYLGAGDPDEGSFTVDPRWQAGVRGLPPGALSLEMEVPTPGFERPADLTVRATAAAAGRAVVVWPTLYGTRLRIWAGFGYRYAVILGGAPQQAAVHPAGVAPTTRPGSALALDALPGETRALAVRGWWVDHDGGEVGAPCPSVTWSTDQPAIAEVDATGVVTALAPGVATVTGTCKGVSATATITVNGTTLALSPGALTVPRGARLPFTARSGALDVTAQAEWASSDPSVATVAGGEVTGVGVGATVITATWQGGSVSRPVTVLPPVPISLAIAPLDRMLLGGAVPLTVTATYSDGTTRDVSADVDWTSSAPATVHVSTTSRQALGRSRGIATLTATLDDVTATTTAEVWVLAVGGPGTIAIGASAPMSATLAPPVGAGVDVAGQAEWSADYTASNPAHVVATVAAGGVVTGVGAGPVLVRARLPGYAGDASFGVLVGSSYPTFIGASLTYADGVTAVGPSGDPRNTLTRGQLFRLRFFGRAQVTTSTGPVTVTVEAASAPWYSNSALVTNLGSGWFVAAGAPSTGAIEVGASAPPPIYAVRAYLATVAAPATRLALTPAFDAIPQGTRRAFTATVRHADGSRAVVTPAVAWSVSGPAVTVDGDDAVGATVGTATVTATYAGVSDSARIDVGASLALLGVTPTTATVVGRGAVALTALGATVDGGLFDLTDQAAWSSDDPAVVVVDRGVARGAGPSTGGAAIVIATIRLADGSTTDDGAEVTVTPAALLSIAVTPASAAVMVGLTAALTATATWSDGPADVTGSASWTSSEPAVATVVAGVVRCLTTSVSPVTITAAHGGAADSAAVTCHVGEQ